MDEADDGKFIEIEVEKGIDGLGINVVGGKDSHHIPGDSGIFVTKIRPGTRVHKQGRLSEGDRILSVDDCSLIDVSHEEAVEAFRRSHGLVKLKVELQGEKAALDRLPNVVRSRSSASNVSRRSDQRLGRRRFSGASVEMTTERPMDDRYESSSVEEFTRRPYVSYSSVAGSKATDVAKTASRAAIQPSSRSELGDHHNSSSTASLVDQSGVRTGSGKSPRRDAFYYARDAVFTVVGLATVGFLGYFIYRRLHRR